MRHLKMGLVLAGVAALGLTACNKKTETATTTTTTTAGTSANPLDRDALPKRKAGLWEQTISVEGMPPITMKACLDANTDAELAKAGAAASKEQCSSYKTAKTAAGYSFAATCNMGTGGTIVSSGELTGDFDSAYEMNIKSTTTGAQVPQMNRESAVKVAFKWAGACPEGMVPGDQQMPDGTVLNMSQFDPAKAKAMAKEAGK